MAPPLLLLLPGFRPRLPLAMTPAAAAEVLAVAVPALKEAARGGRAGGGGETAVETVEASGSVASNWNITIHFTLTL